MYSKRITYLFQQYDDNLITTSEKEELYELLRSFDHRDEILELFENSYKSTIAENIDKEQWNPVLDYILSQEKTKVLSIERKNTSWFKWLSAAAVFLLVALGIWFFNNKESIDNTDIVTTVNDIKAPEKNRAMITLADGKQIFLDSTGSGVLATEGGINLVKNNDGELIYQLKNPADLPGEAAYNTLYNPRGSRIIHLNLSDGTRVWLNSETTLTYPTVFVGDERRVKIDGEAYFEVTRIITASGRKQSFFVEANGVVTEVLGTQFNVNAHGDEVSTKISLIEGSIKVSARANTRILSPGQQAGVTESRFTVAENINTEEALAWKNGKFIFSGNSIDEVMRQVSRWYNVDVAYHGKRTEEEFVGIISRHVNVSELLTMLQKTGAVRFEIKGNTIIIKQ